MLGVQANFPMNPRFLRELEPQTDAIDDANRSELIAGYSCPAGSIVFFSECGANLTWAAVASFFLRLLSVVLPLLFLPPVPMLLPRWLLSVCLVC